MHNTTGKEVTKAHIYHTAKGECISVREPCGARLCVPVPYRPGVGCCPAPPSDRCAAGGSRRTTGRLRRPPPLAARCSPTAGTPAR